MRTTSAPIITAPESRCQVNAAMKAPVADGARKDGSPSGTTSDTCACINVSTVTPGRCRRVRQIISCRFATVTMSNGRIAICYGLLRFANRLATKPNRDKNRAGHYSLMGRQSAWLPAGRELGIRTIEERPDSPQFDCCGQNANSPGGRLRQLRAAVCYGMHEFAKRDEQEPSPGRAAAHSFLWTFGVRTLNLTMSGRLPSWGTFLNAVDTFRRANEQLVANDHGSGHAHVIFGELVRVE
jgi:hypothetical protein